MELRPANFAELLPALVNAGVESVLIGGSAAIVHGSARLTFDVDVVYRRTPENYDRLADALAPLHPYLRGAPPGLPFHWDARTIQQGMNFTLVTDLGAVDVLGMVTGGGTYEDLLPNSVMVHVFGVDILVVSLPKLIQLKRAAGRRTWRSSANCRACSSSLKAKGHRLHRIIPREMMKLGEGDGVRHLIFGRHRFGIGSSYRPKKVPDPDR